LEEPYGQVFSNMTHLEKQYKLVMWYSSNVWA